jgi:vitamin B12 transport system permease protein
MSIVPRRRSPARAFQALLATLGAAMLGLTAGALWMVPVMLSRHALPWLALPTGALLGLAIRRWIQPPGALSALLAAAATLIAALYVGALMAAAKIAGVMGLGLTETLRTAGVGMLLALSRFALSTGDCVWLAGGMLAAAWVAVRKARDASA